MKILFVGGTRFFGAATVAQLLRDGHSVAVLSRRAYEPGSRNLPPLYASWKADRRDAKALAEIALDAWDVVIDNAAFTGADVESLLKTQCMRAYVLTSSIAVYRFSKVRWIQPLLENSVLFESQANPFPDDPHWKYAYGKWEAERALRMQDQIPWITLRFSMVYGPCDPLLRGAYYLHRLANDRELILPDAGKNAFHLLASEDIPILFSRLMQMKPPEEGMVYNVAGAEVLRLVDFVHYHSLLWSKHPKVIAAPFRFCLPWGGPLAYEDNWVLSTEALRHQLGFVSTPLESLLRDSAQWYLQNRKELDPLLASEAEKERVAAEKLADFVLPIL